MPRLYTSKLPLTAVQVIHNDVLPFFEEHRVRVKTVLSDNGREFCGRPDRHPTTVQVLRHIIRAATYQKNDAADAEAISEAAQRPTMQFVAVKTEAQQARGMLFRTRDLLVRQRTQTINALRGHLAEYGVVAPQGRARIGQLAGVLEDGDSGLLEAVAALGRLLIERIDELDEKIDGLDREIRASAREGEETARLMTIPGIGPITAMALQAFAPPMESFKCGRDFSAWLGLVPRQHTTGGKPRLGRISKMGQRDLRRLLITGAMTVVQHAIRRGEITDPWLAGMLARKPKMLVAVALANRTARMVWALSTKKEIYQVRAAA